MTKISRISRTRALESLKAQSHLLNLLEFELESFQYAESVSSIALQKRQKLLAKTRRQIELATEQLSLHHEAPKSGQKRNWFQLPRLTELSPAHENILYHYANSIAAAVAKYKKAAMELRRKLESTANRKTTFFPYHVFTLGWLQKKIHAFSRDTAFQNKQLDSFLKRKMKSDGALLGEEIYQEIARLGEHFDYVEKWNVHLSSALLEAEKFRCEIVSMKQVMSQEKLKLIKFKSKLNRKNSMERFKTP
ncbi:MAG: hypothetical protein OXT67_12655 [Zetaproteobacteria bacterium]|nr:hypothetical protein [Zetaproteobacteria bacterium]